MRNVLVICFIVVLLSVGFLLYYSSLFSRVLLRFQSSTETKLENKEFEKAITTGSSTTCTFIKEGTIIEYTIKGKFTYTKTTTNNTAYMINDGQFIYIWADGQKNGTKIPVVTNQYEEKNFDPTLIQENYKTITSKNYKTNCKEVSLGINTFVPPLDVDFIIVPAPSLP